MNTEAPRPITEIVYDLLTQLREREWVDTYIRCGRGCCGEWEEHCADCGKGAGGREHDKGCRIAALIAESEAYLKAEEEPSEDTSRTSVWERIRTGAAA